MRALAFLGFLLVCGCGGPQRGVQAASGAGRPAGASVRPAGDDRCGFESDSTLSFSASVGALGAFLEASLAPFVAEGVPADRLTFPLQTPGCRVIRMDVQDLTDPRNASTAWGDSVYVTPGHAYHFYALWPSVSFSHIAFFEPDTTVIFEAVNCTDRGDTVDDAVAYLRTRHPERWSAAVETRIRAYREAGDFGLTDPIVPSLLCACEICYLPPSRQGGGRGK